LWLPSWNPLKSHHRMSEFGQVIVAERASGRIEASTGYHRVVCGMYRQLTGHTYKHNLPDTARACRYFEARQ
jgi:hypothetical protein